MRKKRGIKFLHVFWLVMLVLLSSCLTTSAPKLTDNEEAEILWEHKYEQTLMSSPNERFKAMITEGDRIDLLHDVEIGWFTKEDSAIGDQIDLETGKVIKVLTKKDLLEEEDYSEIKDNGISPIIRVFPSLDLEVRIPNQKGGLVRNNINKAYDDIIVRKISTNTIVNKITRKGLVLDCLIQENKVFLFYYKHKDHKNKPAVVKHDLLSGKELFSTKLKQFASVEMKAQIQVMAFANSAAYIAPRADIYNFSGIIINDNKIFISGESLTVLDVNTGEILWRVKNNTTKSASLGGVPGAGKFIADIDPTPLFVEDSVIIRNVNGDYRCLNKNSGEELWQKEIGWSEDAFIDGEYFYVSLGLNGYKIKKRINLAGIMGGGLLSGGERTFEPMQKGTPGYAKFSVKDGSEIWRHEFKDGIIGATTPLNGDGLIVFSGMKIYNIDFTSGKLTEKLNIEETWGYKKAPVYFEESLNYANEVMLFFNNEIVWLNKSDLSISNRFDFGMEIPDTAWSPLSGFKLEKINTSLLLMINSGMQSYLYFLDAQTRTLRYMQTIHNHNGFGSGVLFYPEKNMYLLSEGKNGKKGYLPAIKLTAYNIK